MAKVLASLRPSFGSSASYSSRTSSSSGSSSYQSTSKSPQKAKSPQKPKSDEHKPFLLSNPLTSPSRSRGRASSYSRVGSERHRITSGSLARGPGGIRPSNEDYSSDPDSDFSDGDDNYNHHSSYARSPQRDLHRNGKSPSKIGASSSSAAAAASTSTLITRNTRREDRPINNIEKSSFESFENPFADSHHTTDEPLSTRTNKLKISESTFRPSLESPATDSDSENPFLTRRERAHTISGPSSSLPPALPPVLGPKPGVSSPARHVSGGSASPPSPRRLPLKPATKTRPRAKTASSVTFVLPDSSNPADNDDMPPPLMPKPNLSRLRNRD
ncbi:uncharacterized protein V1516DRAFT_673325 [Lipomyces oligophaga]|uniref:uncharacterized protein n=1 Tax=Lipomyces oligophaga TaxID=45792 RepID=UPI0034CD8CEE